MTQIQITETILRDAHQCLIATRMRTEDMLPICKKLDDIGYWSLECWGGATFDACVRFLKEDPWERLRKLRAALPNTRLQMLLRGQNLLGYRHYADDVVNAFIAKSAANGIDVFRIFDAMNDVRNVRTAIEAVKKAGKHAQGTISYTVSPVHTNEQFVTMAIAMRDMGCDSIAIKDMAGLLTPQATGELTKALVAALDVPIQLHSHATSGLAELCQWEAIKNGCTHIDTAISAFAGGASHPPTESMVAALRDTPYDTGLNLEALQEIGFYFHDVRKKYKQFESDYTGVDTRVQINQVPGGMISNLSHQLKQQNALNKMSAVLEEIPRVRTDLGYPPLVTPTSQIVGTQAVMNVLTSERYKTITNEVKLYLQGKYGQAPGKINQALRRQAIGDEQTIDCRPADLLPNELEKLRSKIAGLANSEEDVLTYAMFPDIGGEFLEQRNAGTLVPEPLKSISPNNASKEPIPVEFEITLHGETYHIRVDGTGHKTQDKRPFYLTVDGQREEVFLETIEVINPDGGKGQPNTSSKQSKRMKATKPGHVTTTMPGTIIEVLVKQGAMVKTGDAILITEAMKMETEIQAPIDGKIVAIHVQKGDSVNPDETLIEIE
ncbi:MAG: sodium-extruding oxaloacetate decarboxylase subunit alpha [Gammaproteobacteria bacterium]|nr:sodium-extruding oxaloacetate decarboxylase subunit alpha [Gammaproteobacteria bacterium]